MQLNVSQLNFSQLNVDPSAAVIPPQPNAAIVSQEKNSLHNVTSPTTATPWTVGIIIRDFAYKDSRHHGIYPKGQSMEQDLELPIQGQDLLVILRVLESDLSRVLGVSVLLSTVISNFNHSAQHELEMDVEFGQELIVIDKGSTSTEIKNNESGLDRWASMDDEEENCILQVNYEPELKDFADTITGFQDQKEECFLCLRLKVNGHLQGVGSSLRGKAKVELQDIGLIPNEYRTCKN